MKVFVAGVVVALALLSQPSLSIPTSLQYGGVNGTSFVNFADRTCATNAHCNDRGTCGADGFCSCNAGYAGATCAKTCAGTTFFQNGTVLVCSGHGVCPQGLGGRCRCDTGYFSGRSGCNNEYPQPEPPANVSAQETTETSVTLAWQAPANENSGGDANLQGTEYVVEGCEEALGCDGAEVQSADGMRLAVPASTRARELEASADAITTSATNWFEACRTSSPGCTMGSLKAGTSYNFCVRARFRRSKLSKCLSTFKQATKADPPHYEGNTPITNGSVEATSIRVDIVPPKDIGGGPLHARISEYTVQYRRSGTQTWSAVSVSPNGTEAVNVTLSSLQVFTQYDIRTIAENVAGEGNASSVVQQRTKGLCGNSVVESGSLGNGLSYAEQCDGGHCCTSGCALKAASYCSSHGSCTDGNTCTCGSGYAGQTCQYSDGTTCSGHGTAQSDGSCTCQSSYAGSSCQYSDSTTCSGHGTAQSDGSCTCQGGYVGSSCQYSDGTTCSGHGTAQSDGSCTCQSGYAGTSCQYSDSTTCSGHGTAQSDGSCTCQSGYAGTSCSSCAGGYFTVGSNCVLKCNAASFYATAYNESASLASRANDLPQSCTDLLYQGIRASGTYKIWPYGGGSAIQVYCDMETDGGGWTLAFQTREFVARINQDPGPAQYLPAQVQSQLADASNTPKFMSGHAVRDGARELQWRCSHDASAANTKWWVTSVPSDLRNTGHDQNGQTITTYRRSSNAASTPTHFVEGSTNYPTYRYMFLSNSGASCGTAYWGGSCYSTSDADSPSGTRASQRMCDTSAVGGEDTGRFWLYYRTALKASCMEIKMACPSCPSGDYAIDTERNGRSRLVYCDMTTDGGGWTLILRDNYADTTHRGITSLPTEWGTGTATDSNSNDYVGGWNALRGHYLYKRITSPGSHDADVNNAFISRQSTHLTASRTAAAAGTYDKPIRTLAGDIVMADQMTARQLHFFVYRTDSSVCGPVSLSRDFSSSGDNCWNNFFGSSYWENLPNGNSQTASQTPRYVELYARCIPGATADCAVPSCGALKKMNASIPSGMYYVRPDRYEGSAVQAYCDMETDGGIGYTYFVTNDGATINSDISAKAQTYDDLGALCSKHGLQLVDIHTGSQIVKLRDIVTGLGYSLTTEGGVPLGFDYALENKYYSLVNRSKEITPLFDALRSSGVFPNGDYFTNQVSDSQQAAGFGWRAEGGIEDWDLKQHPTKAVICSTNEHSAPVPRSCKEIKDRGLASSNGYYIIDPDGPGGEHPRSAYCDLSDGGYTLCYAYDTSTYDSSEWPSIAASRRKLLATTWGSSELYGTGARKGSFCVKMPETMDNTLRAQVHRVDNNAAIHSADYVLKRGAFFGRFHEKNTKVVECLVDTQGQSRIAFASYEAPVNVYNAPALDACSGSANTFKDVQGSYDGGAGVDGLLVFSSAASGRSTETDLSLHVNWYGATSSQSLYVSSTSATVTKFGTSVSYGSNLYGRSGASPGPSFCYTYCGYTNVVQNKIGQRIWVKESVSYAAEESCQACHSECNASLGCSGPLASQCAACKNVKHNGDCVASCPTGTAANGDGVCV